MNEDITPEQESTNSTIIGKVVNFLFTLGLICLGCAAITAFWDYKRGDDIEPGQVWVKEVYKSENPFEPVRFATNTVLRVESDWVKWSTTYRRVKEPDAFYIGGFDPMPATESTIKDFKLNSTKLSNPPAFVEKIVTVTNVVVKEVEPDVTRMLLDIQDYQLLMLRKILEEFKRCEKPALVPGYTPSPGIVIPDYPIYTNSTMTNIYLTNMIMFSTNSLYNTITLEITNFTRPSREIKRGALR